MTLEHVDNGIAIGHHISVKLPGAAQRVFQQECIGARGLSIDAVVRAHDGLSLAFGHGGAKRRQVGVFHIVL